MATDPKLTPPLRAKRISSLFRPPEPLWNSLQCGFAGTAGGIPIEEEKAKLRLVLEVARKAWT